MDTFVSKLTYGGKPQEDLQEIVKLFEQEYSFKLYTSQTNLTNDKYNDELLAQRHRCMSFVRQTTGRALTIATAALATMLDQEAD